MATLPDDQASALNQLRTKTNNNSDVVGRSGYYEPRPNPLDRYASSTYQVSLYMATQDSYQRLLNDPSNFPLDDTRLLMQSGGTATGRRNTYFRDVDFSIDDLTLQQIVGTKGTGAPFATVDVKFRITEPNGVTLFDRLKSTVDSLYGQDVGNYYDVIYIMVLRFYGYDDEGNPISPTAYDEATKSPGSTEILLKYIPLQITGITFKVGARVTEYNVEAVSPHSLVGLGQVHNKVPINVELSGLSLQELFNSQTIGQFTENSPQAGSSSTKSTVYTRGLIQVINNLFEDLRRQGQYQSRDEFSVVFLDPAIGSAKLIEAGDLDTVSPNDVSNTRAQNPAAASAAQARSKRRFSIYGGTPITQILDKAIRLSTFINDQQSEKAQTNVKDGGRVSGQETRASTKNPSPSKWYRIIPHIVPKQYDTKRKAWSYKITYYVSSYRVHKVNAASFRNSPWPGANKWYSFSFSGNNTSVLGFEQDFNFLYYLTFNELQKDIPRQDGGQSETVPFHYSPTNSSSKQGASGKTADLAAAAAGSLYSPADLAESVVTIVGDPELLFSESNSISEIQSRDVFLKSSASFNHYNTELYYVMYYRKSNDYNLQDGSPQHDPNTAGVMDFNYNPSQVRDYSPSFAAAYNLISVNSYFRRGSFTQELRGLLLSDVDPLGQRPGLATDARYNNRGQISRINTSASATVDSSRSGVRAGDGGRSQTRIPPGSPATPANTREQGPVLTPPGAGATVAEQDGARDPLSRAQEQRLSENNLTPEVLLTGIYTDLQSPNFQQRGTKTA